MTTMTWMRPDQVDHFGAADGVTVVQLSSLGEWTVALEPYGFQGVRPTVLESLSLEARALSVFWNVNLDNDVVYAENGRVVTSFDLMGDVEQRTGIDPSALDEVLARVGLSDDLPTQARKAKALALGEEISRQILTVEWLRSPMLTFDITDPLPDPIIPSDYLHPRAAFLDEPEFARILANPSVSMAPDIIRMVVSVVIRATGVEHPLVAETIRVLEHGERSPGERESLRTRLAEQAGKYYQQVSVLRREGTAEATDEAARLERAYPSLVVLREALHPSPLKAAHDAATTATRTNLPDRTDIMRLVVLRNLVENIEYQQRRS